MKVNLPVNMSQSSSELPIKSAGQAFEGTVSPFTIQMGKIMNHTNPDGSVRNVESGSESAHDDSAEDSTNNESMAFIPEINTMEPDLKSIDVPSPEMPTITADQGSGDASAKGMTRPAFGEGSKQFETVVSEDSHALKTGRDSLKAPNNFQDITDTSKSIVGKHGNQSSDTTSSENTNPQSGIDDSINCDRMHPRTDSQNQESHTIKIPVSETAQPEKSNVPLGQTGRTTEVQIPTESMSGEKFIKDVQPSNSSNISRNTFLETVVSASNTREDLHSSGGDNRDANVSNDKLVIKPAGDGKTSIVEAHGNSTQFNETQRHNSIQQEVLTGKALPDEHSPTANKPTSDKVTIPERNPGQNLHKLQMNSASNNESIEKAPEGNMTSNEQRGESEEHSDKSPAARTFQNNGNIAQSAAVNNSNPAKTFQTDISPQVASGSYRITESIGTSNISSGKLVSASGREFMSQISERIQILAQDGGGVIRIRLQPDEFGHIEIRAEATSKGLVARIAAESNMVKSIMENNLSLLQQNLNDQGFKVDRIQVILQNGFDFQSHSGHSAKSGHSSSGQQETNSQRHFGKTDKSADDIATNNADENAYQRDARFYTVA